MVVIGWREINMYSWEQSTVCSASCAYFLVSATNFSNIIATLRVSVSGQMWAGTTDDSEELEGVWGADWRNWRGANELELITLPWCYKQIDNKTEAKESVFPLLQKQGNQWKMWKRTKAISGRWLRKSRKVFQSVFLSAANHPQCLCLCFNKSW